MKIICIGRNYAEHAKELNNAVPESPVVFMKPSSALLVNNKPFYYPDFSQDIHHEGELVLRIGRHGKSIAPEHAWEYIDALAFGIDFTARDVQSQQKAKGLPWEIAKAFDSSAPISGFTPVDQFDPSRIELVLQKNGTKVQHGFSSDMLFSVPTILAYVSRYFRLLKGDLIYTGTPPGVGPVQSGDLLEGWLVNREGQQVSQLLCEIR